MSKFCISILLIISGLSVFSQDITISGYVIDSLSGESIIGANIYVNKSNQPVLSNEYGYYNIILNQGDSAEVIITHIGYKIKKIKISAQKSHVENFYLTSNDILIDDVVVTATNKGFQPAISTNTIPIQIAQKLPSIGGENDIMKVFRLMPGVQSAENKSSLLVRGGSDDQNLIIVDDVPLYYVNHLGGFVSVFNSDALKDATLIKGGFPAHYGNRLSSVFDIRMKDGNLKQYKKNISIGLLSTKFSIEGPIEKNKSSFIISARRFNLDLITRPITYFITNKVQGGYYFYDLNVKIHKKFNDKNHIFFSYYSGNDKFFVSYSDAVFQIGKDKTKAEQEANWGNLLFAFRFNHIFNAKFFSNTTLSYTQYRQNSIMSFKEIEDNKTTSHNLVSFYSGIKDVRLNTDFQYLTTQNYKIQFGGNLITHIYTPGKNKFLLKEENETIIDTSFNNNELFGYETNFYLENKIKTGRVKSNLGVRLSYFFIGNKGFLSLEPRINNIFQLSKDIQLTASFAKMKQNIHLLTFASTGMPMNIWIPATANHIPEKSLQVTFGVNKNFNKKYSIGIEGYYKTFENLVMLKSPSILFSPNQNYMDFLEDNGIGNSYGIELLAQKKTGKFQSWIAYTFSKTYRQFENINRGEKFPFDYDRTHSLSVVGVYNISKKITISANWEYGTGFPFTFMNQKYCNNYAYIYTFDKKNGMRMEDFHKLDISIQFSRERKNKFRRTWSFDFYNVYNRKNPTFYVFKTVEENNKPVEKLFKVTMFPFIPSISYSIKF